VKLSIGTIIKQTLSSGKVIQLTVDKITLITDKSMPFVHIGLKRVEIVHGRAVADYLTTVFDELVRWTNEPGWQVVR